MPGRILILQPASAMSNLWTSPQSATRAKNETSVKEMSHVKKILKFQLDGVNPAEFLLRQGVLNLIGQSGSAPDRPQKHPCHFLPGGAPSRTNDRLESPGRRDGSSTGGSLRWAPSLRGSFSRLSPSQALARPPPSCPISDPHPLFAKASRLGLGRRALSRRTANPGA